MRGSILIRVGLAVGGLWALGWTYLGWTVIAADPQISWFVYGLMAAVGFAVFYGAGVLLEWVFWVLTGRSI